MLRKKLHLGIIFIAGFAISVFALYRATKSINCSTHSLIEYLSIAGLILICYSVFFYFYRATTGMNELLRVFVPCLFTILIIGAVYVVEVLVVAHYAAGGSGQCSALTF